MQLQQDSMTVLCLELNTKSSLWEEEQAKNYF